MQFAYRARNEAGALVTGEAEAADVRTLQEELFHRGLIPIAVGQRRPGLVSLTVLRNWWHRVKNDELIVFTRQCYTLFRAGVSIDSILETLAKQAMGRTLRDTIEKIRIDVGQGASLSEAFGRHPRVFNELYIAMIAAGEEAGILEQALAELVKLIDKEETIRKNIKSATFYPKIVLAVMCGAVTVLMTFVVPKFEDFFAHYGATLPLPTLILMSISNLVRSFWFLLPLLGAAAVLAYHRYAATRSGRLRIDQWRFQFPVFGDLNLNVASARFGHILASLYKSGLPMPRCLEVVARVIGNSAYALEVYRVRDDIQRGMGLADAMQQRSYFPPLMIETTAVGERAGSLDEMLEALSEHYDLEVAQTIKNLTTLLEPMMLIGIFGMVTLMALAIFLPIWNMSSVVTGS